MIQLIKDLINEGYLKTPEIINAFQKIDRADFVSEEYKDEAYQNAPLLIGYGQTISQPLTVAFMLELLQPRYGDKILDIGSGSGWQTALLANIVGDKGKVFGVDVIPELVSFANKNIAKYNFIKKGIVELYCYNAKIGMPNEAPFDKIIVAASAEKIIPEWKKQLKIGGRLVAPIKNSIWLFEKTDKNKFNEREYEGFVFVPFV